MLPPVLAGAALGGLFSVVTFFLMLTQQVDVEEGLMLVVMPPWGGSAHDVIRDADLPEVSLLRAPLGAFTKVETPSDAQRLYDHGAWLLVNGKRIAFLCS